MLCVLLIKEDYNISFWSFRRDWLFDINKTTIVSSNNEIMKKSVSSLSGVCIFEWNRLIHVRWNITGKAFVLGQFFCSGSVVALGIVARTGWDRGPTAEPQKPDGEAGTPKRKTILLLSRCINGCVTCIKKWNRPLRRIQSDGRRRFYLIWVLVFNIISFWVTITYKLFSSSLMKWAV